MESRRWSQQGKYFGSPREGKCFQCGKAQGDLLHLWKCTKLKDERFAIDPVLAEIGVDIIPAHLFLGIPDKLKAGNSSTVFDPIDVDKFSAFTQKQLLTHQVSSKPEMRSRTLFMLYAHPKSTSTSCS